MRSLTRVWNQLLYRRAMLLHWVELGPRGKRISGNALFLLAMQVGSRLLMLVLTAYLARTLGLAALGRYLLALTIQAIALAISDLGLTILVTREMARPRPQAEDETLLGLIYTLKLMTSLLGMLVVIGAIAPLSGSERLWALITVAFSMPPEALLTASVALMKGRQQMAISSAIQLGVRLVATIGGMALVMLGGNEVTALGAYGVANMLGLVACDQVIRRWGLHPRWGLPRAQARVVIRESMPFAIVGIASMLYRRFDLLLLSYWWGDMYSGLYGAAYRIWEALSMFTASLLDALFPELARMAGETSLRPLLEKVYHRAQGILLTLSAILAGLCVWAAPWLMAVVYGRDAAGMNIAWPLRLMVISLPLGALYLLDGHLLYALGEQRRVSSAMMLATGVNVAANTLAVWRWGIWGAAGVALLSEAALFALLRLQAQKARRSRSDVETELR